MQDVTWGGFSLGRGRARRPMLGEGSAAAFPSGGAGVRGGRRLGELAVDAAELADAAGTEVFERGDGTREPAGPPPFTARTRTRARPPRPSPPHPCRAHAPQPPSSSCTRHAVAAAYSGHHCGRWRTTGGRVPALARGAPAAPSRSLERGVLAAPPRPAPTCAATSVSCARGAPAAPPALSRANAAPLLHAVRRLPRPLARAGRSFPLPRFEGGGWVKARAARAGAEEQRDDAAAGSALTPFPKN
ncbi:hypothetical protein U9M48_021243 [Paspalum notatum var. saurae]|uniref:Uncharacterized protein n=1 Tax=Paspalum notatum var. saurae TaxID=547442 RepID=A0AAQ3TH76_PASNO